MAADVFEQLKAAVEQYADKARSDAVSKLQTVADALNSGKFQALEAAVKADVQKAESWIAQNHAKIASSAVVAAAGTFVAKLFGLL